MTQRDFRWQYWPLLPIYPYGKRRTLRREVLKNTIWTFDQVQGIFYVVVPIRMTVVRLETGGLLVYAPIAPTPECIRLMRELEAEHGVVKQIVLPTISGLEHKVFVGPFARKFPDAHVYIAPQQWSFPVNLPLSWLGFPRKRTHFLSSPYKYNPFGETFDYAILGPIKLGLGSFGEVALFHKPSRTALLTDSVISIPKTPPESVELDPYPLLFHARDNSVEAVEDTPAMREKGWQRICLFANYFQPDALEVLEWGDTWQEAQQAPDRSKKAYFGFYPFRWRPHWKESFEKLQGNGRLLVAPILQKLILNRAPQETITWANLLVSWHFERLIPCHFQAPLEVSPREFRQAFTFLEKEELPLNQLYSPLPQADLAPLDNIEVTLRKGKLVPPPQEKV
ncbi:hypothetical protein PCC7418_1846 [Halothece sp. PCC 7418]|uniref:DUF4336 domain-containing protein n=1 Tax=Halothece sp. (strain PCC 7418) TaxID=65093 RepID=UPI0002A06B61|nr:DUF4336 domain-containing protein [Halothece sp. PCC 7418]AFZ44014.1 hypothetical protein PCC7418_1846 [Halothece sp. PCC 7418]